MSRSSARSVRAPRSTARPMPARGGSITSHVVSRLRRSRRTNSAHRRRSMDGASPRPFRLASRRAQATAGPRGIDVEQCSTRRGGSKRATARVPEEVEHPWRLAGSPGRELGRPLSQRHVGTCPKTPTPSRSGAFEHHPFDLDLPRSDRRARGVHAFRPPASRSAYRPPPRRRISRGASQPRRWPVEDIRARTGRAGAHRPGRAARGRIGRSSRHHAPTGGATPRRQSARVFRQRGSRWMG